jgi:hypothetical protein
MAQIYPEDRGTNYAVRYGRRVAKDMIASFYDMKGRVESAEKPIPDRALGV